LCYGGIQDFTQENAAKYCRDLCGVTQKVHYIHCVCIISSKSAFPESQVSALKTTPIDCRRRSRTNSSQWLYIQQSKELRELTFLNAPLEASLYLGKKSWQSPKLIGIQEKTWPEYRGLVKNPSMKETA